MARKIGSPPKGIRMRHTRVKTARGRKSSSTRWLQRQLNDPYVQAARQAGYRSRAAFKLIELDERFSLLRKHQRILDLGAAPGGWTQVAVERAGKNGKVVAVDLLDMEPVAGAEILKLDFRDDDAPEKIRAALGGPVDLVISDMAADTTGHRPTDHLRTMYLVELALEFAAEVLVEDGAFVAKVFKGGTEKALLDRMKTLFRPVKHAKPDASRAESVESYVVAQGFRGRPEGDGKDGKGGN